MKKVLSKITFKLFYVENNVIIKGIHNRIYGNVSGISGDVSGIYGNVSGISGDVSGIIGDVSGISGDVSGISGDVDEAEISDDERKKEINITNLIKE